MIGNTHIIQYNQHFRINQTIKKLAFSSQEDLVEIKGVKIPKENFEGKELKSLKGIKLSGELPLDEGLRELYSVKEGLCSKGYKIYKDLNDLFQAVNNFIINEVHKDSFLKNRNFVSVIGNGRRSVVINIGENPEKQEDEVLKISLFPNHPKALGRIPESFDMPIIRADSKNPGGESKVHWCVQPKADTESVKYHHIDEMRRKIEKSGDYRAEEMMKEQLGFYDEELYLLDPECVKVKMENGIPGNFYF